MKISAESTRLALGLMSLTSLKYFSNPAVNSLVESPNHILHRKQPSVARCSLEKSRASVWRWMIASWSNEPCPIEFGAMSDITLFILWPLRTWVILFKVDVLVMSLNGKVCAPSTANRSSRSTPITVPCGFFASISGKKIDL